MGRQGKLTFSRMCKLFILIRDTRVNVFKGPETEKIMMTGLHRVCDIHCKTCMKIVGWTYVRVHPSFHIQYRSMLMSRAKSTKKGNLLLRELTPSRLSTQSRIHL